VASLAASVASREGAAGFFKGNLSATYLWVTYAAVQFTVYSSAHAFLSGLSDDRSSGPGHFLPGGLSPGAVAFASGAFSGLAATAATYPFDFARTGFAAAVEGRSGSLVGFLAGTVRAKGLGGIYAGVVPAMMSIVPLMGLNFLAYETLMQHLSAQPASSTKNKNVNAGLAGALSGGASKLLVYVRAERERRKRLRQKRVASGARCERGALLRRKRAASLGGCRGETPRTPPRGRRGCATRARLRNKRKSTRAQLHPPP
jgi:solute carrier family 25 thiamine pyrophosphate transporter 19